MGQVSVVVPFDDRWYFAEIIRGATERIEAAGHQALVHVIPPESSRRAIDAVEEDFGRQETIGAVVAGFKPKPEHAPRAMALARPVVLVGGSTLGFPTVMIDDIGAAREAMMHLRSLGHRRIVHLAGELDHQMDFSVNGRRARGYRQAMESAGLPADIVEVDFDHDDAATRTREILARESRPTAIFAVSDEIAFGALDAIREAGLRPGHDMSVIGIDDHERAEAEGLSTIRQRPGDMSATAVEMLLAGLERGPDPKQSRLSPITLVPRASTGPHRTF